MNILVIKTTSLGDVLHATPHLQAIRDRYPDAHLSVLTATGSAQIYAHHPAVDRLVLFDHARFKKMGLRSPCGVVGLFRQTLAQVNDREYDLAFDLQGLLRTVVFLYFSRARKKFVKGRWPGLDRYCDKQLHAIDEMTQVLAQAGIPVGNTQMVFYRAPEVAARLQDRLDVHGLAGLLEPSARPGFVVVSPFTRWASKNWPLDRFVSLAQQLGRDRTVLITATEEDRKAIDAQMPRGLGQVFNLAGELSLPELAELMSHAALVVSGDSFPMHLATAVNVPLITMFGPTDERKTGPRSGNSQVLRPTECRRCDKPDCARACLEQIPVSRVEEMARKILAPAI